MLSITNRFVVETSFLYKNIKVKNKKCKKLCHANIKQKKARVTSKQRKLANITIIIKRSIHKEDTVSLMHMH